MQTFFGPSVQSRRFYRASPPYGTLALGRIRDGLVGLLDDPEPDVRERAAWALGTLRSPAAVDGLVAALDDADKDVQERIAWALGRIRNDPATDGVITALDLVAGDALEEISALIRLMDAPDPELRRAAIEALSEWSSQGGGPEIAPPLPPPTAVAPDPAPGPDA